MPETSPASAAGVAPQGQQPQAPMGSSPATGPTPNKGYEAAGLQKLGMALKMLTEALPLLGAQSEPGQEVLKVLSKLAKMVPPGTVTPAAEKNTMEQAMMKSVQQGGQMQQLQAARMQGAGGSGGARPPGMPGMGAGA